MIILEDGVVTKLEWQLETRFVSEEEIGTERVVSSMENRVTKCYMYGVW